MLLDISIIPQTSEELFYFVTKRIPYLCGFWRFANAYEYDMLKGNINRMFVTDDIKELACMHEFAKKRLEELYEYHYARLTAVK